MARPPNRYTNPETGVTKTTKGWCTELNISDAELSRRIKRHGLCGAVFVRKAPREIHNPWTDWERDFLKDCHADPLWSVTAMAKKLDRTMNSVREEMCALGLRNKAGRRPSINWLFVWRMDQEGLSMAAIGRVLGSNGPTVRAALNRMRAMTEQERHVFFVNCDYL